jgi:hypothetical protein
MTITNNISNELIIQNLVDKTTITGCTYLFEFIDTQDNSKYIVLDDSLSGKASYSSFDITLVSSPNDEILSGSTIYLQNGQFEMRIYQTTGGTINTKVNAYNGNTFIYQHYIIVDIPVITNSRTPVINNTGKRNIQI